MSGMWNLASRSVSLLAVHVPAESVWAAPDYRLRFVLFQRTERLQHPDLLFQVVKTIPRDTQLICQRENKHQVHGYADPVVDLRFHFLYRRWHSV